MVKFWEFKITFQEIITILLIIVPQISIFFLLRTSLLDIILESSLNSQSSILLYKGIYLGALSLSAIIGSYLFKKTKRKTSYLICYIYRIIAILSLIIINKSYLVFIPIFLLGTSYGIGFPIDLSFLADNTEFEERGRVSGFTLFITFVTVVILLVVSNIYDFSISQYALLMLLFQFSSIGSIILFTHWEKTPNISVPVKRIKENKKYMLYLLPWLMFSIANGANIFFSRMVENSELAGISTLIKFASSCIFCLVAGTLADYYGRKPAFLIGFVILGVSYSLNPYINNPLFDILTSLLSGSAWSFIMVSYLFTIVGDLGPHGGKEIYYAISGVNWMVIETSFAFLSSVSYLVLPIGIISTILSASMFIAVIPLLYATETLPEKKIADRLLSNYFNKVLELLNVSDE